MSGDVNFIGTERISLLYDIKMGNPNGDPDENRPRVLPDGTIMSPTCLKRFARDFLKFGDMISWWITLKEGRPT